MLWPLALQGRSDWTWQHQARDVLLSFLTTQKHFLPCLPNPSKEGHPVALAVPVAWNHLLLFLPCFLCVSLKPLPHETSPSSQMDLLYLFFFFFFFFFFFLCLWGGTLATRGQIGATAAGLSHSHTNTESELCLQPIPQLTKCQIPNPLSKARDGTCILMDTSQICFCCTTTGTPIFHFPTPLVLPSLWVYATAPPSCLPPHGQ